MAEHSKDTGLARLRLSKDVDSSLQNLRQRHPQYYVNPLWKSGVGGSDVSADTLKAEERLKRFGPVLCRLFPELEDSSGVIESPLLEADWNKLFPNAAGTGGVYVKADGDLPVTGSIKARGGVYEVLKFIEQVACDRVLLDSKFDYLDLLSSVAKCCFAEYRVVVGSTGNLGYSVGLVARAFGLQAEVYMSVDAKQWKKDRLRALGATVVEVQGDYAEAVADARQTCAGDPQSHFIDDEESTDLFFGYSTAALRIAQQISVQGVELSIANPLYVLLPCGVGGAPGGITYGLNCIYGAAVRCIWIEPVDSPCFLLKALRPKDKDLSVYDIGLSNNTIADGLAVPKASNMVFDRVCELIYAYVTLDDSSLLYWIGKMHEKMSLRLEPSAASGFSALAAIHDAKKEIAPFGNVIVWTTGGSHLPDSEFEQLLNEAGSLSG